MEYDDISDDLKVHEENISNDNLIVILSCTCPICLLEKQIKFLEGKKVSIVGRYLWDKGNVQWFSVFI